MIDFTPSQKKMVAAGITVFFFTLVSAFVLFVAWLLLKGMSFAAPAIMPVLGGVFLAMLFKPYYAFLVRIIRNPTLSVLALFASLIVPMGCLIWFGGTVIVQQISQFALVAPTILARLSASVNATFPNLKDFLVQCGCGTESLQLMFLAEPARFSHEILSAVSQNYGVDAVKAGLSVARGVTNLFTFLLVLLFFVYFLLQPNMTGTKCSQHLPFLKEETRLFVARQIDAFLDIVVSFFQRQVIICLLEGLLYGLGFALVGLPYGFLLGFLLGTLNLVPFLGTVVCLPFALPLAYLGDGGSGMRLALVAGVWLLGQILDGYVITPRIQGGKTGLGYAGVIFSFLFWGGVFHSMLGLLLAIPLSAFCVVFWRAFKTRYVREVI